MSLRTTCGAIVLAASGLLGACSTMVEFTSTPPGAEVTYQGQVIGTTPFTYGVSDQFGWFSVYSFTASKEGFEPLLLSYEERSPIDAQQVVPTQVHFDLKAKPTSAAPAPVSVVRVKRPADEWLSLVQMR